MADYSDLPFERPTNSIKTIDVTPPSDQISSDMKKYEEAARGYILLGFEGQKKDKDGRDLPLTFLVQHQPEDAPISQIYRVSTDPSSTDITRLTHFDLGSGRRIAGYFPSVKGDNWRGSWRAGGAIFNMDLDGSEHHQIWRYWEDADSGHLLPPLEGEIDNRPGVGRIERITHDNHRYLSLTLSDSNKILAFCSDKENSTDTLVYVSHLTTPSADIPSPTSAFHLPSRLITPPTGPGTKRWTIHSISTDDKFMLIARVIGNAYQKLYLVDLSSAELKEPEQILLPGVTEPEEHTTYRSPAFSKDPNNPHTIYLITNAYGDKSSVISFDSVAKTVIHITTPEAHLRSLRPIHWDAISLQVTPESISFLANVEGWRNLFVMPLSGPHENVVVEIKPDWEGGSIGYVTNERNGHPNDWLLKLRSYRSTGFIARMDLSTALSQVSTDSAGNAFITASLSRFPQVSMEIPSFRTLPPLVLKFKSFDGLEVPVMYYRPKEVTTLMPLIIGIHGGPEGQSTCLAPQPLHNYLINELGCAVMYPNVRGSSGYGKRYMAADDVEKREDSVKDIGALLDHIKENMKEELDASRIAVMGSSYGGYMVFACLVHFSSKITCGIANFGIAHWPSFLENTANVRRALRRMEYGDESDPEIRKFLERISPINHTDKIISPLLITHGETDTRVPVAEALTMWETVKKNGIYTELILCEKEGHGYRQKGVIEFVNAAKVQFFERFLKSKSNL